MTRGNRTDLGSRVEQFFKDNEGEYSVKQVAGQMGLAPNTVGQYLLGLYDWGMLTRRMNGLARGRHYVYRKSDTPMLTQGEQVWYDGAPGTVQSVSEGGRRVWVNWENGGDSTVDRSDLLTDAEHAELE